MEAALPENWLERRDYPDLPEEAELALRKAAMYWHEQEKAEAYLDEAYTIAPDHIQVHIAKYKFLFYKHDYDRGADAALACIDVVLRKRQIHKPLLSLELDDAPFGEFDVEVRFLLSCIMAYGYCLLRNGSHGEGREVLDLLAKLDIAKQTSVLDLLPIVQEFVEEQED